MNAPTLCMLVVAAVALPAGEAVAASLCTARETAYFNCVTVRQRVVSLCGNAPQALQYRFGQPGRPELQFPENAADGPARMFYAHYSRYRTDRVEVRFEHGEAEYTLFDYREGGRHAAGVRVRTGDGAERTVDCASGIDGRLGRLENELPCDADSALNLGACPQAPGR